MRTTTIGDLQTAFTTQIRRLVPTGTAYREHLWSPQDDVDNVPGGEIRRFYVEIVDEKPIPNGIVSPSAIEYGATVLVHTAYPNIKRRQFNALKDLDARQIFLTLAVLQDTDSDPSIAGLVSIEHTDWTPQVTEQGAYFGAHTYDLRFLASGIPGAS